MSEINFYRGPKKSFNLDKHEDGIYLAKDTHEIIVNGDSYGGNPADDEDLTVVDSQLKLADRAYDPDNFSGKGYKILRKNIVDGKNILTLEMINEPNTVYEIRYDFDLNGETIEIPDNCTLKFEGGKIERGTILSSGIAIKHADIDSFKSVRINSLLLNYEFSSPNIPSLFLYFDDLISSIDLSGSVDIDFKGAIFTITDLEYNNKIQLNGKEGSSLTLRNVSFKGNSILDPNTSKPYLSDQNKHFLFALLFDYFVLDNVRIESVRGTGIFISHCKNSSIRNCTICYTTASNIAGETYGSITCTDCIIEGTGDYGEVLGTSQGTAAGIALGLCNTIRIINCTVKNTLDTGVELNASKDILVEGCLIDTFGKDGLKALCSPYYNKFGVYHNNSVIFNGNIIRNKFNGNETGSSYIIVSNTLKSLVSNNITESDSDESDHTYWYSLVANIDGLDIQNTITVSNNSFHNSMLISKYEQGYVLGNIVSNFILASKIRTRILMFDNIAENLQIVRTSGDVYLKDNNIAYWYCTYFSGKQLIVHNNTISSSSNLGTISQDSDLPISLISIKNNIGFCKNPDVYMTIRQINLIHIEDNVIFSESLKTSIIAGVFASILNVVLNNNLINFSPTYENVTLLKPQRCFNSQLASLDVLKNIVSPEIGDVNSVLSNRGTLVLTWNGTKWVTADGKDPETKTWATIE